MNVPVATDDVFITLAGAYTVTQDVAVAVSSLTLGGDNGTQTLVNAGAALTVNSNSSVLANGVLASGGLLNGSGALSIAGRFDWTAGNMRVSTTILPGGVFGLGGSADKGLTGALTNFGSIIWSGSGNLLFDPTVLDNRPGALLDLQTDASLILYNGTPYVANAGTIRKSAGTGTNVFNGVPLRNTGIVEARTGGIFFSANGCLFQTGTQFKGAGANILGAGTITLDGTISSENLVFGGAFINGTNTLTGSVEWTGGNIDAQGRVTVAAGSTLHLTGPAFKGLVGVLNNDGLVTWSGTGDFHMGSSTFNNRAGAVFDAMKDGLIHWPTGTQPLFINAGTFRKSAGTGSTSFSGVVFRNSGVVDAQAGTVNWNVSGTSFENGTQFVGAGTNLLSGGAIMLSGSIYSQNLVFGGAFINGTNTLIGNVEWTAGNIDAQGRVTVAAGSTLHLTGPAVKGLVGILNNDGLVTWSGAGDFHMGSSTFNNRAGAVFDAMKDGFIHWPIGDQPIFINAGTFRKSAGSGSTAFSGVVFRNRGVVDAQVGMVNWNVNGTSFENGTQFIGAGTNLLSGGTIALNGSIYSQNLELGGAIIGGTNTMSGSVVWTGGYIDGPGIVTIATNGIINLAGAGQKGLVGMLKNRGTVLVSGSGKLAMGTLTAVTATIQNEADSLFDMASDAWIEWTTGTPGLITNAGTFRKSAGTGTTLINAIPFANSGTVDAETGAIAFNTTATRFDSGTQFKGAGTSRLVGGLIALNGSIHSENLEIAGAGILGTNMLSGIVRWTSGTIAPDAVVTVAADGALNIAGPDAKGIRGILNNSGVIRLADAGTLAMASTLVTATIRNQVGGIFEALSDAPIAWTGDAPPQFINAGTFRKSGGANFTDLNGVPFSNTGTVDVQSGVVRFLSSYTQTGGRLQFGLTDLSHFGQVRFSQTAPLTGTLGVNLSSGFRPRAGDTFAVISYYPAYSGAFGNFDLPSLAAWQTNNTIYGANAVTLTVLNARPTFDFISEKMGDEQTAINFTASATDLDVGQSHTFSLLNAPAGAGIDASMGAFSWTPTEAQGPSTNVFTVQVTDNGTPALSHTQAVTIVVNEVNRPPQFAVLGPQTIPELAAASFTDAATDPDLPPNMIHYALLPAPAGVTLDTSTGVITWTPTEAQGPGPYEIAIVAIDDGVPPLRATNRFNVVVTEVNSAPLLRPVPDLTAIQDVLLLWTNTVSDTDLPANIFSFCLITAPKGMGVGKADGVLQWRPTADQVPGTNYVTVRVTDNGVPPLSDLKSFAVHAFTLPRVSITHVPGSLEVSWPAYAEGFTLQSAGNLQSSIDWITWTNPVTCDGITNRTTDDPASAERYFRLRRP